MSLKRSWGRANVDNGMSVKLHPDAMFRVPHAFELYCSFFQPAGYSVEEEAAAFLLAGAVFIGPFGLLRRFHSVTHERGSVMKSLFDDDIDSRLLRSRGWLREQSEGRLVFETPSSAILGQLVTVLIGLAVCVYFDVIYYKSVVGKPGEIGASILINIFFLCVAVYYSLTIEQHRTLIDLENRTYHIVGNRMFLIKQVDTGSLDELTIGIAGTSVSIVTMFYFIQRPPNFFVFLRYKTAKKRVMLGAFNYRATSFAEYLSEKMKLPITDSHGRLLKVS